MQPILLRDASGPPRRFVGTCSLRGKSFIIDQVSGWCISGFARRCEVDLPRPGGEKGDEVRRKDKQRILIHLK